MTTHRDHDRSISAWLVAEAPGRAPDDVLEASRDRIRNTRQRRAWLPAWRSNRMNIYAKLAAGAAAAAAVLVVAVVGYQFLPRDGGSGGQPTIAPSPSQPLLASGTFRAKGAAVVLDATGEGSTVTGRMTVSDEDFSFTVDLECTRTTDAGLIWIGGDVTESTFREYAPEGSRTAIVLKRGSPVQAVFVFQMADPRSASCQAFFDDMIAIAGESGGELEPIEGTVELGP